MNLKKSLRGVCLALIVCVATIPLLSGCFAQSNPEPETTPVPAITLYPEGEPPIVLNVDVTTPMSPPYDEWENWAADRDEQFEKERQSYLAQLETLTGIQGLKVPSEPYLRQGYSAVAKFGTYCIIVVFPTEDESQVGLSILSRINTSAGVDLPPNHSPELYRQFTGHFSSWCEGRGWPGMFGDQVEIVIDQPPANEA